jgi:TRAP-type C4-dicarboxylate transport system permease small subunit
MLERAADNLRKFVFPVSRILGDVSMIPVVFMTLLIVVDVLSRRFLNAPIKGSRDMTELAFSISVFLPMAWCAIKGGHVDLDVLVVKFPKRLRLSVEIIILLLTTAMLGVLSWQLAAYGVRLQNMNQETAVLGIPVYPFLYLAALGSLFLTLVYLINLISSLGNSLGRSK